MPTTYKLISKVTVGSGGAATIEFTSIPQTYTDLLIKYSLRQSGSSADIQLQVRFNGNTGANYSRKTLYSDSSVIDTGQGSGETSARFGFAQSSTYTANAFGSYEMYIPNYTSSNNKSFSDDSVNETNAATVYGIKMGALLWSQTAAITSISIQDLVTSTNFAQHSTARLYGIKNS